MAYGSGWALEDTEAYSAQYDEIVLGDSWLEDQVEILYFSLQRGPTEHPFSERMLADWWYTILPGPPQLMVFYQVDVVNQVIRLESLKLAQLEP